MEAPIVNVVDKLQTYLGSAAVKAQYPELAKLGLNTFNDPEMAQYPALDLVPMGTDVAGVDNDSGALAEAEIGTLEYVIYVEAAQYLTAVRDAFRFADVLRQALNCRQAAIQAGVAWVRLEQARQAEPDVEKGRAFVALSGRIRAKYAISALGE